MILDSNLIFTGTGKGATGTIADGTWTDAPTTGTQYSSNVLDLGVTSGIPSSANGGGARDLGIGDDPSLKLLIDITTTFVYGAGGGTTYWTLQGTVDDGTGNPAAGSWTDMWISPTYAQATLVQGAQIGNVNIPRAIPGVGVPRFLRLKIVTATATYTAGDFEAGIVLDRFDQIGVSGIPSGYPAGVVIAN